MFRIQRFLVATLPLLATLAGCGGRDLALVQGQVTFDGRPVSGGALVFSPIPAEAEREPGKSATGDIQPNGTFQLSTYRMHDGAIIGRHRVRYIPVVDDEENAGSAVNANLSLPADMVVEIESGKINDVAIELVGPAPN